MIGYCVLISSFLQVMRSTTISWKTQIKCSFIRILTAGKKKRQERRHAIPAWIQTQPSVGPYEPEALRWVQARLDIDHPIPTLHPDSCFQWIVAWYSWYLRAVSNRIGSKLHGTEYLVDFSTATTPPDLKVKQALRGARETLHPA